MGSVCFRVLCVDDESDICDLVELSLGLDSGLSVRTCASGEKAVAIAADWHPHIIVSDVMMPVMDGPTMLARLRACPCSANIPVVFLTASAQLERLESLGAIGIILKPFDPMTLASSVRRLLGLVPSR